MLGLSIKSLLLGLFGLLVAIIGGQGYLANRNVDAVNDSVIDLATNWLPSVNVVREMDSIVARFRLSEARHIMSTEEADMRSIERDLDAAAAELAAARKRYEPMIASTDHRGRSNAHSRP